MLRSHLLPACALCGIVLGADGASVAATLRPFRLLAGNTVRLSDLFADMAAPDRILGPAPAPGARVLVPAPQLAAIARDFGVDWRPSTGAEQATLERNSTPFAQAALLALLREKLTEAGAPADAAVSLPGYVAPALPAGAIPHAEISDFTYDSGSFHFTATLSVTTQDAEPSVQKLGGQVMPMVDAVMLTHRMRAGTELADDDLRASRLPATALHGRIALSRQAALGLALRRDTPAGQPLAAGDLTHPTLVARNEAVRMELTAGGISLAAEGVALEDGAQGAHIRVQNPSSRAIMLAEVTGAGEVRIMPGHAPIVVAAQ